MEFIYDVIHFSWIFIQWFWSSIILVYPKTTIFIGLIYILRYYFKYRSRRKDRERKYRVANWQVGDELEMSSTWYNLHCRILSFERAYSQFGRTDTDAEIKYLDVELISKHSANNGKVITVQIDDVKKNVTSEIREERDRKLTELLNKKL